MLQCADYAKGTPVSLDKIPNSRMNVPQDAVHVTVVSLRGTPCLKLTVPYGRPVAVSNATQQPLNFLKTPIQQ